MPVQAEEAHRMGPAAGCCYWCWQVRKEVPIKMQRTGRMHIMVVQTARYDEISGGDRACRRKRMSVENWNQRGMYASCSLTGFSIFLFLFLCCSSLRSSNMKRFHGWKQQPVACTLQNVTAEENASDVLCNATRDSIARETVLRRL